MILNPKTTYLYLTSLILVYGSVGVSFAVGASDYMFMLNVLAVVTSFTLIIGLYCAITGKNISVSPGYRTSTRYETRPTGTWAVTESKWQSGGTYNARLYGFLFMVLTLLFGILIVYAMWDYMRPVDAIPASIIAASTIPALLGAVAFKSRTATGTGAYGTQV